MVVVLIDRSEKRARGICSKWLRQFTPGVFCGVIPHQSLRKLTEALDPFNGVVILTESNGKLAIAETTAENKTQKSPPLA